MADETPDQDAKTVVPGARATTTNEATRVRKPRATPVQERTEIENVADYQRWIAAQEHRAGDSIDVVFATGAQSAPREPSIDVAFPIAESAEIPAASVEGSRVSPPSLGQAGYLPHSPFFSPKRNSSPPAQGTLAWAEGTDDGATIRRLSRPTAGPTTRIRAHDGQHRLLLTCCAAAVVFFAAMGAVYLFLQVL